MTFVHVAFMQDGHEAPLPQLPAFQRFQRDLAERCDEAPELTRLERSSARTGSDPEQPCASRLASYQHGGIVGRDRGRLRPERARGGDRARPGRALGEGTRGGDHDRRRDAHG